jgi:hypothetical protein
VPSRATAGTTDQMPGPNPEGFNNDFTPFVKIYDSEKPVLAPVLCGYFLNIVRQLLNKQRKHLMTYLLRDAEGKIYDALVKNIEHHSLSDLLIELMQVNFPAFQMRKDSDDENTQASERDQQSECSED